MPINPLTSTKLNPIKAHLISPVIQVGFLDMLDKRLPKIMKRFVRTLL